MRTKIWNQLANVKFKALYVSECSKKSSFWSRLTSFLLAIGSASSVAAWAFWQQHTTTWAMIIGAAQLFQIGLPFIPFLKNNKEFLAWSFELERLYLEYEKLWDGLQNETINLKDATEVFYRLRDKQLEIAQSHKDVSPPHYNRWIQKIEVQTKAALNLSFP